MWSTGSAENGSNRIRGPSKILMLLHSVGLGIHAPLPRFLLLGEGLPHQFGDPDMWKRISEKYICPSAALIQPPAAFAILPPGCSDALARRAP